MISLDSLSFNEIFNLIPTHYKDEEFQQATLKLPHLTDEEMDQIQHEIDVQIQIDEIGIPSLIEDISDREQVHEEVEYEQYPSTMKDTHHCLVWQCEFIVSHMHTHVDFGNRNVYISNVYTKTVFRRKGLMTRLMKEVIAYYHKVLPNYSITLEADSQQISRLYEKCGFKINIDHEYDIPMTC